MPLFVSAPSGLDNIVEIPTENLLIKSFQFELGNSRNYLRSGVFKAAAPVLNVDVELAAVKDRISLSLSFSDLFNKTVQTVVNWNI